MRDRITNRAGRFIVDWLPRGDVGYPSLELNVVAADANEVLDAFERWSRRRIPEWFTLTGIEGE